LGGCFHEFLEVGSESHKHVLRVRFLLNARLHLILPVPQVEERVGILERLQATVDKRLVEVEHQGRLKTVFGLRRQQILLALAQVSNWRDQLSLAEATKIKDKKDLLFKHHSQNHVLNLFAVRLVLALSLPLVDVECLSDLGGDLVTFSHAYVVVELNNYCRETRRTLVILFGVFVVGKAGS